MTVEELEYVALATAEAIQKTLAPFKAEIADLRARALVPGPPGTPGERGIDGRDGRDGKDGVHGKDGRDGEPGAIGTPGEKGADGRDGFSLEDFTATFDGERTLTLAWKGPEVVTHALTLPMMIHRGVWAAGEYQPQDVVTWAGSGWMATDTTTDKPGVSKAWRLIIKAGRDGKDGPEGKPGPSGPRGDKGDPGRYA